MTALIRLAGAADAPAIAAIYAPFCESTSVSFENIAPPADEMARRIRMVTERLPWLVLEDGGTVAGYAYASLHRERAAYAWSVDVAAYVASEYRQCGVGRALYTALLGVLRRQGYYKAHAGITLPNPASVALHEAVGFETVGVYRGVGYKLGVWHDVRWYQLVLQAERLEPELPRPVTAVIGCPEWLEAMAAGLKCFRGGRRA